MIDRATDAVLHQAFGHTQAGRPAEAEVLYRRVVAFHPDMAEAHAGLGLALLLQGRTDAAIASFRRALEIAPDNADALYKLGNLLLREGRANAAAPAGRIEESFSCFLRHARLTFGAGEAPPLPHRLRHDQEQLAYLVQHHGLREWKFHLADGSRIASRTVNEANVQDAVAQWNSSKSQIIVTDNLLTEEALEKLRRCAPGTTISR